MSSSAIQVQTISVTGNGKMHVGPSYVTRRSTSFDSKNRKEILDWLSPLTFHGTHERIKREPLLHDQSKDLSHESYRAGQWLLESDEFDEWRSRKFPKLWYHGMPGAGKTVLASIIISHLLDLREKFAGKDSGTQIAYLYLSYKEQQNQTLEYLIGSIIRQLAEDHDQLPSSLISAWQKAKKHGSRDPTQAELSVLFTDLTSERPTYIVLDGLDECRMDVRTVLMRMLVQIEKADIGLLLTSRILPDFDELSKGFRRVNITANPQDLNLFIDYVFNNNWRLTEYAKQDRRLRDDIKFGVGQKCNGMFLLASLHMRLLSSQLSLTSVRKKLQCLPEDLDATYDETLNRIEAMDPHKKKLAFDVLAWIVFSLRPLSIQELQHALAVEPGDPNFDSGKIFLKDDITAFCGGLVTIDQEVVRLVHYTTQSYFAKVAEYRFPGFHSVIVQTCASYLSLDILEQPDDEEAQLSYADYVDDVYADPEEIDFQQPLRNGDTKPSVHFQSPKPRPLTHWAKCDRYPFLTYAASFIGQHLDHISDVSEEPETLNLLLKLLRERPKRNFLARLLYQLRLLDDRDTDRLSLFPITPNYLSESINEDDDDDPVSYGGSDPGLEIEPANELTDENSEDEEAEEVLARILRQTRSDDSDSDHWSDSQNDDDDDEDDDSSADADDKENETGNTDDSDNFRARANSTASRDSSSESSSVVSRVQSTSRPTLPQPARKELPQMTALHLACYLGNPSLVEIFAQETTDIDALDPYSESSLVIAVKGNHFDAVTVLLKHGASVNVMEKEGHEILLYGAQQGHVEFVQAILSQALGNVLVAEKKSFWLAFSLFFAYIQAMFWVYLGRISIFCQQNKNDITSAKGSAGAPTDPSKPRKEIPNSLKDHLRLLLAAASGDCAIVTGLIQLGKIKPKTESSLFYATALFFAVEFNHLAIVKDLLENGVSVDSSSLGGTTPLHRAVARNNIQMVKLLIEHKPNLEMKDNNGETAWAAHANQDHFEAVEILRSAGADPNTRGAEGVTGLFLAAAGGHVEHVKFLLGSGVNPSIRTVYGWTPLHWAAHNGKMECVRLLMDAGSDLNVLSDTSETPLDKARLGGQHVIAKILVEAGAKTAQEFYASKSPNSPSSDNFYDRDDDYGEGNTVYSNWFDNFVKEELSIIAVMLIKLDSRTEVTTAHKRKVIQWVLEEVRGFRDEDRRTFKDETQVQWQDCVKVLEEKEKALLAEEALQIQEAPPTEDAPQSEAAMEHEEGPQNGGVTQADEIPQSGEKPQNGGAPQNCEVPQSREEPQDERALQIEAAA